MADRPHPTSIAAGLRRHDFSYIPGDTLAIDPSLTSIASGRTRFDPITTSHPPQPLEHQRRAGMTIQRISGSPVACTPSI